uniref:Bcl-2-associated X protein n=1 Tax=Portunus trituberculatus TaxID=210409 RepID=A0A4Y6JKT3_PORTR|nr:Bcl-2-associated X protein [Portunus trituberculatus]
MTNGSIESKSESNVWPSDDSAPTQPSSRHHQEPSTPGDFNDNSQDASYLPPLLHRRPSSPVSVAELQERAVQDSQNNNVDENSNDRHYDQYATAAAAYPSWETSFQSTYPGQEASHFPYTDQEYSSRPAFLIQGTSCPSYSSRETSSHLNRETSSQPSRETSQTYSNLQSESFQPNREATPNPYCAQDASSQHSSLHSCWGTTSRPDQSVRPRVRQPPQHSRDESDHVSLARRPTITRRDSESSGSNWQHGGAKHRRNHSEGTRYPPLPNLNCPTNESGELPQHLPGYGIGSHDPHNSQGLVSLTARGGGYNSHLPVALQSDERVTQEAEELLTTFTSETLRNNRLEVPPWLVAVPSPHMVRAGRELRLLADAFACTAERRKVRHMAESVNLSCIEMDDFFHLCTELFYDGITRERIVALFTFVGDVAVHQVRIKGEELIHRLIRWSLKYLVEHVCRWVQEAGGWVAVLTCGANFLYRCAVFVFCVCGSVAAGLFIYKTLKNG